MTNYLFDEFNYLPEYTTIKFTDLFGRQEDFVNGWKASGLYQDGLISDENVRMTYWLLVAKYGNNPIANNDVNVASYKFYSVIFRYGPSWAKKLEIQENVRALTEDDLREGAREIMNHAQNPGTTPTTATLEEVTYIDSQSSNGEKKSKIEAYALLWNMIEDDVTTEYIAHFQNAFKSMVMPEMPLLYETEDEQ